MSEDSPFDAFAQREGGYVATFNHNYAQAYACYEWALGRARPKGTGRAVDLGCGDGWTAQQLIRSGKGSYLGIDPSRRALENLSRNWDEELPWKLIAMAGGAEQVEPQFHTEIRSRLGGPPNLLLCNATLHQVEKGGTPWQKVLRNLLKLGEPDSIAVIGEYYYPPDLSKSALEACYNWIRQQTGQDPTAAGQYPDPSAVSTVLECNSYRRWFTAESIANTELPLRYQVVVAIRR